jgi:hypothetical protein
MSLVRDPRIYRLARRLSRRPCNRDGADKTWVLRVMVNVERFFSGARRVGVRRRHASIR